MQRIRAHVLLFTLFFVYQLRCFSSCIRERWKKLDGIIQSRYDYRRVNTRVARLTPFGQYYSFVYSRYSETAFDIAKSPLQTTHVRRVFYLNRLRMRVWYSMQECDNCSLSTRASVTYDIINYWFLLIQRYRRWVEFCFFKWVLVRRHIPIAHVWCLSKLQTF